MPKGNFMDISAWAKLVYIIYDLFLRYILLIISILRVTNF
jgi:hypothetical protein